MLNIYMSESRKSHTLPLINHIFITGNIIIIHVFLYLHRRDTSHILKLDQRNTLHACDCNPRSYETSPHTHFDILDAILRIFVLSLRFIYYISYSIYDFISSIRASPPP